VINVNSILVTEFKAHHQLYAVVTVIVINPINVYVNQGTMEVNANLIIVMHPFTMIRAYARDMVLVYHQIGALVRAVMEVTTVSHGLVTILLSVKRVFALDMVSVLPLITVLVNPRIMVMTVVGI